MYNSANTFDRIDLSPGYGGRSALEAAMATAVVGADRKGGKRGLAPAVMFALLGASLLAACAPLGPQTVEPGVTPGQQPAEVQEVVIVPTEEPTETPTKEPTETPEPTAEPTATPEPEMGMQNEQGQWWDGAGWQSLPEGEGWQVEVLEDGQVQATDANGAEYTWVEGKWLTEAQIETQKVVEYVAANSEVINRVSMEHVEFRASEALQRQIYDRLPSDALREQLGDHPLYMMVWNAPKMQEVLSGLSIEVEGYKDKLSLADHKLVVTFMNFNEDIEGVTLDHFHGGASDAFVYGAYLDETTGEIHLAMRVARFTSAGYDYHRRNEIDYVFQGMIPALARMSNFDQGVLFSRLSEDTRFDDDNFYEEERGVTWLLHPAVGNPYRESAKGYANIEFYRDLYNHGWIPPEVRDMMDF